MVMSFEYTNLATVPFLEYNYRFRKVNETLSVGKAQELSASPELCWLGCPSSLGLWASAAGDKHLLSFQELFLARLAL